MPRSNQEEKRNISAEYQDVLQGIESAKKEIREQVEALRSGQRRPLEPEKVPSLSDLMGRVPLHSDEGGSWDSIARRIAHHIEFDGNAERIFERLRLVLIARAGLADLVGDLEALPEKIAQMSACKVYVRYGIQPAPAAGLIGSPKQVLHGEFNRYWVLAYIAREMHPYSVGNPTPQTERVQDLLNEIMAVEGAHEWIEACGFFAFSKGVIAQTSPVGKILLRKTRRANSLVPEEIAEVRDILAAGARSRLADEDAARRASDPEVLKQFEIEQGFQALRAGTSAQKDYARQLRYRMVHRGVAPEVLRNLTTARQVIDAQKQGSFACSGLRGP